MLYLIAGLWVLVAVFTGTALFAAVAYVVARVVQSRREKADTLLGDPVPFAQGVAEVGGQR